ncbi:MAG: Na+/H+ antiporter NhaC [Candidatus Marinamargulisbacteria bacterium]|jgi:Na+/H+ antiporter NhaC
MPSKVKPVSPISQIYSGIAKMFRTPAAWIFFVSIFLAIYVGQNVAPTWTTERVALDVQRNQSGDYYYKYKGKEKVIAKIIPQSQMTLTNEALAHFNSANSTPTILEEYVVETVRIEGKSTRQFSVIRAKRHWKFWSLLPAIVAILLCWLTKEPISALLGGVIAGAFLLGQYNITDSVLVPALMTKGAAGIFILYLWLLGGLMGIWSKTGAAKAFAEMMTTHVVKGPKSAKLVAWMLGIIFFQGGSVSTVLVGTTVKPFADKEKVSHEELSYIVDSTASPIASILAFNAWPGYVQAFIFVSGVSFLATEELRLAFFFKTIPLSFYCFFAVIGTFLLSIDKAPFLGKKMTAAIKRSRETGQLDAPGAKPLSSKDLDDVTVPKTYQPHVIDFFLPLATLITVAIGTFVTMGSPQVRWAFGGAVVVAASLALLRGLKLHELMEGFEIGLKGVVMGSVILILAVTIGGLSKETGGGIFLVELLGDRIPYWLLPVILQLLTIIIAFSTGTSWGTYAVAFPLAMPLAWAVAQSQGLGNPEFFMMVCFATVMNGSIYGDQCSPISDTTVLSSMWTGCDLMDHVKTQIIQATTAAGLAAICWTVVTLLFAK